MKKAVVFKFNYSIPFQFVILVSSLLCVVGFELCAFVRVCVLCFVCVYTWDITHRIQELHFDSITYPFCS